MAKKRPEDMMPGEMVDALGELQEQRVRLSMEQEKLEADLEAGLAAMSPEEAAEFRQQHPEAFAPLPKRPDLPGGVKVIVTRKEEPPEK